MNNALKLAIAAAAVVVVAVVGVSLLPRQGGVGGLGPSPAPSPSPSPSPSQAPSPSPSRVALPAGADLVAGTTYVIDLRNFPGLPGTLSVTVPAAGWFTIDSWFLGKSDLGGEPGAYDMTLIPYTVDNLHADPCHYQGSALDPPVGPTADDLATALVAQGGPGTSPATDVTVGGYPGKKVELSIPSDYDPAICDNGNYGRWFGGGITLPDGYGPFTYGKGQVDIVYIVDVDGKRWVIDTNYLPGTSDASLAELDQIVASIRIEP